MVYIVIIVVVGSVIVLIGLILCSVWIMKIKKERDLYYEKSITLGTRIKSMSNVTEDNMNVNHDTTKTNNADMGWDIYSSNLVIGDFNWGRSNNSCAYHQQKQLQYVYI